MPAHATKDASTGVHRPAPPKFIRQRVLLALLESAGGKLRKLDFQKLLFLAHREAHLPHYDFVPYKFGCYSFHAAADMDALEAQGWLLSSSSGYELCRHLPCEQKLFQSETTALESVMHRHADKRGNALLRYVYRRYPATAIRSELAEQVLNQAEQHEVDAIARAYKSDRSVLFTIGYEGICFETFANKLIENDVRLLCDVRRNPLSRKFAFSKARLGGLLPKLQIEYLHLPQLGIASAKRRGLNTAADYRRLFAWYRKALPQQKQALATLLDLLQQRKRVALTCFEKEPHHCHRHCISDHLAASHHLEVLHL